MVADAEGWRANKVIGKRILRKLTCANGSRTWPRNRPEHPRHLRARTQDKLMKPGKESFEETRRRVIGRPPGLAERLTMLKRKRKLLSVLIPSFFISVVPVLIFRDVLEGQDLPIYIFVAVGVVIFVAVFLQMMYRETSKKTFE